MSTHGDSKATGNLLALGANCGFGVLGCATRCSSSFLDELPFLIILVSRFVEHENEVRHLLLDLIRIPERTFFIKVQSIQWLEGTL